MFENPQYKAGTIWRTRKRIRVVLDTYEEHEGAESVGHEKVLFIPKNEYVMLIGCVSTHIMNSNFTDHLLLLWNNKRVLAYGVDSAHDFDIDPQERNRRKIK